MMFVYVPPPKPSPQAEELGQKMAELIRIYRESYSDLNMTEVKQAMGIAENDVRPDLGGRNPQMAMVMGLLLGFALLAGLLFFYMSQRGGGGFPGGNWSIIMIVGALALGLAVVFAVKAATRR
jgi:hypothetical protein